MVDTINGDPERLRRFIEADDGKPVVMINLLRFRDQAAYPPDSNEAPRTGAEAYAHYGKLAWPHIGDAGARVIWRGKVQGLPIAPPDEDWDEALLVEYPSRKAFFDMISKPAYRALSMHRTAALADSRLIGTTSEHSELAKVA
jgi:uncharacterized protein (DUF1330 family)